MSGYLFSQSFSKKSWKELQISLAEPIYKASEGRWVCPTPEYARPKARNGAALVERTQSRVVTQWPERVTYKERKVQLVNMPRRGVSQRDQDCFWEFWWEGYSFKIVRGKLRVYSVSDAHHVTEATPTLKSAHKKVGKVVKDQTFYLDKIHIYDGTMENLVERTLIQRIKDYLISQGRIEAEDMGNYWEDLQRYVRDEHMPCSKTLFIPESLKQDLLPRKEWREENVARGLGLKYFGFGSPSVVRAVGRNLNTFATSSQILNVAYLFKGSLPVDWVPEIISKATEAVATGPNNQGDDYNHLYGAVSLEVAVSKGETHYHNLIRLVRARYQANRIKELILGAAGKGIIMEDTEYMINQILLEDDGEDLLRRELPNRPAGWDALHDVVTTVHRIIQQRSNAQSMQKYKKFQYTDEAWETFSVLKTKNYTIKLARGWEDLDTWGGILHHCIGSYYQAASVGSSKLLAVFENDKLKWCIELDRANTTKQMKGSRNCNPPYEVRKEVEDALHKAIKGLKEKEKWIKPRSEWNPEDIQEESGGEECVAAADDPFGDIFYDPYHEGPHVVDEEDIEARRAIEAERRRIENQRARMAREAVDLEEVPDQEIGPGQRITIMTRVLEGAMGWLDRRRRALNRMDVTQDEEIWRVDEDLLGDFAD